MTAPILSDASDIVSGQWAPWLDSPGIATPADWRFCAQCALDGDEDDLRIYLTELEESRSGYTLPDCEDWRDEIARPVATHIERRAAA